MTDARGLSPSADRSRPWLAREGGPSPFFTVILYHRHFTSPPRKMKCAPPLDLQCHSLPHTFSILMFASTSLTKNLAPKSRKRKSEWKHKRTRFPQSAVLSISVSALLRVFRGGSHPGNPDNQPSVHVHQHYPHATCSHMHTGSLVIAIATPSLWLIPPRD
jgi:hypothetical protein